MGGIDRVWLNSQCLRVSRDHACMRLGQHFPLFCPDLRYCYEYEYQVSVPGTVPGNIALELVALRLRATYVYLLVSFPHSVLSI